jgi:hypothetical protein
VAAQTHERLTIVIRNLFVLSTLILAGVLSILGNVGLWVDRTVYDTDTFVSTTDDVLDDEDVQEVVADRFAQELYVAADVDARMRNELPDGLKFLALPLGNVSQEFLRNASLRLMQRQPFEGSRNAALSETHARLIDAIEGRSAAVSTEGDAVVIDLRPVLQGVAEDVAGRDLEARREGGAEAPEIPPDVLDRLPPEARARVESVGDGELLARLDLPPDAGRFVIEDSAVAWTYRIARYGNDLVYALVAMTVGLYGLSIAVARDRRGAVRNAGVVFALAGLISLTLLLPVEYATRAVARNDAAATSVVEIVTTGYKEQSLTMIGFGTLVAGAAALFGQSSVAVALRSTARRNAEAPSIADAVRERAAVLRIVGFVIAAVALIVWPDPTTRTYLTVLGLLVIYLLLLFLLSSDSQVAVRARERWDGWWRAWSATPEEARSGWVAAHAGALRIAGITVAIGLLVFWPDLSLRFLVMVVALALIYLAGVDLASRPRSTS